MLHISASDLGDWSVYANAVIDTAFLLAYTVMARWWRGRMGTHLFVFLACLDAVWVISAYHHLYGEVIVYERLRALLYIAFIPIAGWRGWLLLRAQTDQRREDRAEAARRSGRVAPRPPAIPDARNPSPHD